jgi:PAS domain S-box-containing protein
MGLASDQVGSDVELPALTDELLRSALAHQRDAVLVTEAERVHPGGRRIIFVNAAFTAMTGFSEAEAVGKTPGITVGRETSSEAVDRIQSAIERKIPVRQEILKYRKDGSTFWAEIDIAPVVDRAGRTAYFVAVMRDVTERRKQGDLLSTQATLLKQAMAAKSQFLANVSHELRTPLHAIVGYTSVLLQGVYGPLSPSQGRALSRLEANANSLLGIINDILDFTKVEQGRMSVNLSEFDLGTLVSDVITELAPMLASSKLNLSVTMESDLFPLRSDRQKVKQILFNLVSNALKFTAEGWIRIEVKSDDRCALLTVADSGIGIAPEDQPKVFEDFWQADGSTSRAFGGTGLGLAICQGLAKMLDGHITLESDVGQGSRFTLHLPKRAVPSVQVAE